MLAGGMDELYRRALAGSPTSYARVEVWRQGARLAESVEFSQGTVTATLQSRVARNLSLTVPEAAVPVLNDPDGLLTPFGNELRCFKGIELAGSDLRFVWPCFRGKIISVGDSDDGNVEIYAADRADEVVRAGFEVPTSSVVGTRVATQVQQIITDAVPDATLRVEGSFPVPMPELSWEYDRGRALDEMTEAVGALWYPDAAGEFIMRPVPWTTPPTGELIPLVEGVGGIVQKATGEISNDGVYNSVTAVGERTDGSKPVYANAKNTGGGPVAYDGALGPRFKLLRLQTPATVGAARGAAAAYLKRVSALGEQWSWAQVPDAAMELGDAILLSPRRRVGSVVQIVAGFSLPLHASASMSVTGRQLVVGVLDD